jgi:hypothetical protein
MKQPRFLGIQQHYIAADCIATATDDEKQKWEYNYHTPINYGVILYYNVNKEPLLLLLLLLLLLSLLR